MVNIRHKKIHFLIVIVLLAAGYFSPLAYSQDEAAMDGMGNITSPASTENSPAGVLYKARCAQCHDNPVGRIPPRASLRYRPPESVYESLTSGVMSPMAKGLSNDQMKSIVKLLTGKEPKEIANPMDYQCSNKTTSVEVAEDNWASVHGDNQGRRSRQLAGFSVESVSRLKLKWAYAYPGGAKGPATVAGDSLFLAGTGYIVALNKDSGCVQWTHPTAGKTVRAITVANNKGDDEIPSVVLFGDDSSTVFALDATTGKGLWQTNLEKHILGRITAAPTVADGVVYVPLSSMEDPLTHDKSYFCCSARGGVAAVDLRTGEKLWKQQHITATLVKIDQSVKPKKPISKEHGAGYFEQGPAGASTYTPLTIDAKRGLVYASTAEEYGFTGTAGPYSVIAYDLKTGKRAWQKSLLPNPEQRARICASKETDCRNLFSTGTSVLIHPLTPGKDVLVVGMKSGEVHALDPDEKGRVVWTTQVADGGDLGGVMYGLASDANNIYVPVADVDSPTGRFTGSLVALDPATGILVWRTPAPKPACSWTTEHCIGGQVAAVTVVSDMVFAGFWDGHLRIYAADDGRLLRDIDTAKEFPAVNGVASGGQVSGYPVTVGKDALYINSGASSIMKSGNALLVYTVDGK